MYKRQEQERVQNLRSKTQSALAETGAVVRSIVVNSVAEIERIKDALMTLKATYTQAQDDLTPEAPAETTEAVSYTHLHFLLSSRAKRLR